MRTANTIERRRYTCGVCGKSRLIDVHLIDKWVVVCVHPDLRGGILPVMQLREEGAILQ